MTEAAHHRPLGHWGTGEEQKAWKRERTTESSKPQARGAPRLHEQHERAHALGRAHARRHDVPELRGANTHAQTRRIRHHRLPSVWWLPHGRKNSWRGGRAGSHVGCPVPSRPRPRVERAQNKRTPTPKKRARDERACCFVRSSSKNGWSITAASSSSAACSAGARPTCSCSVTPQFISAGGRAPAAHEQAGARGGGSGAKIERSTSRTGRSPSRTDRSQSRIDRSPSRIDRSPSRIDRSPSRTARFTRARHRDLQRRARTPRACNAHDDRAPSRALAPAARALRPSSVAPPSPHTTSAPFGAARRSATPPRGVAGSRRTSCAGSASLGSGAK